MPAYEISLIMRKMAHPATVGALKKVAGEIYKSGGYIRYVHLKGVKTQDISSKV